MDASHSMGAHAPLYLDPPRRYLDHRRLSVYCRAAEGAVRELLPDPLEYVSDGIEVFFSDTGEIEGAIAAEDSSAEGGVVVQARHGDEVGGCVVYEFVSTDRSLAAGREIWGYPKKLADVTFERDGDGWRGRVARGGTKLLTADFAPAAVDVEAPTLFPRFQHKLIPSAGGDGYDVDEVVRVAFGGGGGDFDAEGVRAREAGTAEVSLGGTRLDPVDALGPLEVLGAQVTVGDFVLGWGEEAAPR